MNCAPNPGGATDVDYIDPQLSYYGETWKLEAATACKLMNWPDKEGAAGAVATPEVSAAANSLSGASTSWQPDFATCAISASIAALRRGSGLTLRM